MPAYLIADVEITDPERMAQYRQWSTRAMQAFGAEIVVRGGEPEAVEGGWCPDRVVVLRFPDRATARAFYASETYTQARRVREGAGRLRMLLVDGYEAP